MFETSIIALFFIAPLNLHVLPVFFSDLFSSEVTENTGLNHTLNYFTEAK